MSTKQPDPPVRTIEEEDQAMGSCGCSGRWRFAGEEVVPKDGRWLDQLRVRCEACSSRRTFTFDTTAFFVPPTTAWVRLW